MARITALSGSFPRDRRDPAGAFIAAWAGALANLGHEITIVTPRPRGARARETWRPGVHVRRVCAPRGWCDGHLWHGAGAPENLRRSWRARLEVPGSLAALWREARRASAGADLVWSHWAIPFGALGGLAGPPGVPHVVQCHGSDVRWLEAMPFGGALAGVVARRAARVVFVSQDLRRRFLLLGPTVEQGACSVLPMGVEVPPPRSATPPRTSDRLAVLALSRLNVGKGIDVLLRALVGLPCDLRVIGDGPQRAALQTLARELGLAVEFTGACAPHERWVALHAADVLVVPSRAAAQEGSPVVIGEAMAVGLPVVASRVGGIADALGEHGLLVPDGDVHALRAALMSLYDEPARRRALADAGRRAVAPRLWPTLATRYDALIGQVLRPGFKSRSRAHRRGSWASRLVVDGR